MQITDAATLKAGFVALAEGTPSAWCAFPFTKNLLSSVVRIDGAKKS
jgi:hypothetical protein